MAGPILSKYAQGCSGHSPAPHRAKIPSHPSSQGDSRDEEGEEAAHQVEETATILVGCERLIEEEKECWKR